MIKPEIVKHIQNYAKIRRDICVARGVDISNHIDPKDLVSQSSEETELYDAIDSLTYDELSDLGSIVIIGKNEIYSKYDDYYQAKNYAKKMGDAIVDYLFLQINLDEDIKNGLKVLKR